MSYNPYGGKYTYGGSLKHYRTRGSKNGVSNNPAYKPVGQVAVGRRMPDGTYVYDTSHPGVYKYRQQQRINQAVASNSGTKGREIRGLRERQANASMAETRRGEVARKNRIDVAVASNSGTKGREIRGLRERQANAEMTQQRKAAAEAKRKYDKSLIGRLDNATKGARSAVGNWFNKRRAELKTTGKNVGNWLSDRGRDIGKAAKTAYEAVSNSDERGALEKAKANYEKDKSAASKYRYDQAKKAYDSHLLTRLGRGSKNAVDTVSDTARNITGNVSKAVDRAGDFITTNAKNAAGNVKRGAEAVGKAASGAASDAGNFVSTTAKNVTSGVKRGAQAAGRAAGEAWDGQAGRGTGADTARELGKQGAGRASNEAQSKYNRSVVGTASRLAGQLMSQVKRLPTNAQNTYTRTIESILGSNSSPEQKEAQLNNLANEISRSTKTNTRAKRSRAN